MIDDPKKTHETQLILFMSINKIRSLNIKSNFNAYLFNHCLFVQGTRRDNRQRHY